METKNLLWLAGGVLIGWLVLPMVIGAASGALGRKG